MAVSRSMLESLLARVQRRAAEPRRRSSVVPLSNAMRDVARAVEVSRPAPASAPAFVAEDDIEEYDDELIEIIDDGDLPPESVPESAPEARPLELSVSAPSVEMRRHVMPQVELPPPPASTPVAQANAVARPAVAPPPPPLATAAREPLSAEAVSRKPILAADVVQSQGARRELRAMSFVELLDASLDLGS
jgi:hypothetical protein